jgi:hypothetical protein
MPEEAPPESSFDLNSPDTWVPEEENPEAPDLLGDDDPLEAIWAENGSGSVPGSEGAPGGTQGVEQGNGDEVWEENLPEGS